MSAVSTDWLRWFAEYDDPSSSLARRLQVVQGFLREALDLVASERADPLDVLSLCAGDGRDVLPVLAGRRRPVRALLVELDERLAASARQTAASLGLGDVEVRDSDAGTTAGYLDRLPVDVLLACGVFGNVAPPAVRRTIDAIPGLLAPGGVVIWTRGHGDGPTDAAPAVRSWFADRGFAELGYVAPADARFRVGMARRPPDGPGAAPTPQRLFDFAR